MCKFHDTFDQSGLPCKGTNQTKLYIPKGGNHLDRVETHESPPCSNFSYSPFISCYAASIGVWRNCVSRGYQSWVCTIFSWCFCFLALHDGKGPSDLGDGSNRVKRRTVHCISGPEDPFRVSSHTPEQTCESGRLQIGDNTKENYKTNSKPLPL